MTTPDELSVATKKMSLADAAKKVIHEGDGDQRLARRRVALHRSIYVKNRGSSQAQGASSNLSVPGSSRPRTGSINRKTPLEKQASTGSAISSADFLRLSAFHVMQLTQYVGRVSVKQNSQHFADTFSFRTTLIIDHFRELKRKSDLGKSFLSRAPSNMDAANQRVHTDLVCSHGHLMAELIDDVIRNIDEPSDHVIDCCTLIGQKHAHLRAEGFTSELWDTYADCLQASICRMENSRLARPERNKAWISLFSQIVNQMKLAYEREVRAKRSANHPY